MALYLEVSNSLEKLADNLIQEIGKGKMDVFIPTTIVTQTEGVNLWLRERIANVNGIAANISFITPNDIIFKVFQVLGGQYEETISQDTMVWLLYKIMGEQEFTQLFPNQWSYFQTPQNEREKKRMGMAMKVADLFDQYQIYRQDEITKWNQSPINKDWQESDWQEYLWKKLKERSPKQVADKSTVRKFIHENILKEEFREPLREAIDKVYLFGLSIFTNYHLDILKALGDILPVYFYIFNPAPEIYWVEDVSEKQVAIWKSRRKNIEEYTIVGNPILTNWGKLLRNTFLQLYSGSGEVFNNSEFVVEIPKTDSLLHKIQADIFDNRAEDHYEITEDDLIDDSISFRSCFTMAGEVEALYQYLVHLVDKEGEHFSARDISVMVSDIDKYAPFIRAVFDNAPYSFRYKIADAAISEGDNLFSALLLILELNESELTSERVLQLLESSYIRKRFQLEDIELLRSVIGLANIRFGSEGSQEDDTYIVSWRYGLQRLMYGICMSDEPKVERYGVSFFPLDAIEGSKSEQVVRFCYFVEQLLQSIQIRKEERSPIEWKDYVLWVVHNLIYQPSEGADEDYYTLTEQLSRFAELDNVLLETVSFDVFRLNFIQSLEMTKRSSLFINDGITFCSLIPMRSVPFKVIAMLGMGGSRFPRREHPVSFSLLASSYKLGDRNVKDNDKHLFLETLLSAREKLYISYIGRSVKDNAIIPPSILVEELLDYIKTMSNGKNVKDKLVTQLPLHSYSHRYNNNDKKLYRYTSKDPSKQVIPLMNSDLAEKKDHSEKQEISLGNLVSFFKNGPKTFYNKRLGVYYEQPTVLLPETEDFNLDNWQSYLLKSEWFTIGNIQNDILEKWKLTGKLPLKNAGDMAVHTIEKSIAPVLEELVVLFPDEKPEKISFSINLTKERILSGELTNIYSNTLVAVCLSKSYVKSMVEAFIHMLVGLAVANVDKLLFLIAVKENSNEQIVFQGDLSGWDQDRAIATLSQMADLYQIGLERPYPFADIFYAKTKLNEQYLSLEEMVKKIEYAIYSFNKIPVDNYIMKEYERKFYEDPDIETLYNKAFQLVIAPLFQLFPMELWDLVSGK